ncbi:MAG: ABC transporter permease [Nitrospinae bacterium]|nr:ABC transporter permease [Nitrospinota bacterium]
MDATVGAPASGNIEQKETHFVRLIENFLARLAYFRDLGMLVVNFIIALRRLKGNQWNYTKNMIIHQIIFSGVDAIYVVSVISALVGGVVMVQLLAFSPGFQTDAFLMKIMVGLIIKDIAPIFAALILVGRSGSAITVELGQMKLKGLNEALEAMAIDTIQFFHVPRVIGLAVCGMLLNLYFVITALAAWLFISSFQSAVSIREMLILLSGSFTMTEIAICMVKGAALGSAIAFVCLLHGMGVERSATELPQRASRAVVDSFLICFVLDALITVIWYVVS